MKKLYRCVAIAVVALLSVACDKEPEAADMSGSCLNFIFPHSANSSVNYSAEEVTDEIRTSSFSFKYSGDDAVDDTLWFEVTTMGDLDFDADRPLELVQIQAEGEENAVAGTHYVAFGDESLKAFYRMPKGENKVAIPVVLLRKDPALTGKTVVLKFGFKDNGIFRPGYEGFSVRIIRITDRLAMPNNWDDLGFGPYSEEKYLLMMEWSTLEEQTWDEAYIDDFVNGDLAYCKYMKSYFQRKLDEANALLREEGKPEYKESDGTPMKF